MWKEGRTGSWGRGSGSMVKVWQDGGCDFSIETIVEENATIQN